MFYFVSKIAWLLLAPSNVACLLLAIGVILTFTPFFAWGRGLAALATVLLLVMGLSPLGQILILPLEERFPPYAEGEPAPDGIVVLGGSFETSTTRAREQIAMNEAGERLTAFAGLAAEFPDARLVFSGGSAEMLIAHANEAETARLLLESLGVEKGRLALEDRSRNTWQNAAFTRELVEPMPGERWLLVTSAWHMPRAVGAFRAAGFDVVPFPVDYRTRGWSDAGRPFETISDGLRRVDLATREWIGLLAYRLTGRINSLFPGENA